MWSKKSGNHSKNIESEKNEAKEQTVDQGRERDEDKDERGDGDR